MSILLVCMLYIRLLETSRSINLGAKIYRGLIVHPLLEPHLVKIFNVFSIRGNLCHVFVQPIDQSKTAGTTAKLLMQPAQWSVVFLPGTHYLTKHMQSYLDSFAMKSKNTSFSHMQYIHITKLEYIGCKRKLYMA